MTKFNAKNLNSKLNARNLFVNDIIVAAKKHVIESDAPEFTVANPNLSTDEIKGVVVGKGFRFVHRSDKNVQLGLSEEFQKLQAERKTLDELIERKGAEAVVNGRDYFIIETKKFAKECTEALYYLKEVLGFKVETVNNRITVSF